MKCEKCGKEITGTYFTAVGFIICPECNEKSKGTVSMDDIFNKIVNQTKK